MSTLGTRRILEVALPLGACLCVLVALTEVWVARAAYPFDLEWMEGGMLAHAWRLERGLPIYVRPNPDFVPYVYPPGYAALLAALGQLFGLTPLLGRLVSLAGSLAAAGAAVFLVRRSGASVVPSVFAGTTFLGTYVHTGAFLDLVRPDGLLIGLLAWSVALAMERARGAEVAAGLLLAAAFVVKHNALVFVVPLAACLWWSRTSGAAARFTLAAGLPSLVLTGLWQWRTDGLFLTYLLEVPSSHPFFVERVWPATFQEVGTPLAVPLALTTGWVLFQVQSRQRSLPSWLVAFAPVLVGMLAGWWGTYLVPAPPTDLYNVPSSVGFFAIGAMPTALGLLALGRARDRDAGGEPAGSVRDLVPPVLLGAAGFATCAVMRAHNGGYFNVQVPLFWLVAVGGALAMDRSGPVRRPLAFGAVLVHNFWTFGMLDRSELVPTPADLAAGQQLVAACRSVEGPVLSPFAAWIPVYAGKPPSLHYMGVWDLEYPENPLRDETTAVAEAVRERRWALAIGGNQRFGYGLQDHYESERPLFDEKDRSLLPKTGWPARPNRLMYPR